MDLYNGSTAGDSEVLWALIIRLSTDRAEKNKVVNELWGYMGSGLQFLTWDQHG